MRTLKTLLASGALALAGCGGSPEKAPETVAAPEVGIATEATRAANAAVADRLPLEDTTDFDNAMRGFLAKIETDTILNEDGSTAWQNTQFDFLEGDAPASVNPSLWRQGKLNRIHGLFEVTDGIYQLRGYDLSTMTLIRGETGWIIVDPLLTPAVARAGLALANETLGARPVKGVLFTHSHADHFGGVRGVVSEEEIEANTIAVVAPAGFTTEAVSENVLAGNYMSRRSSFQFGAGLEAGPAGHVGTGLGQALSRGPIGLISPTVELSGEAPRLTIDGVAFEFLDAGDTEAPSEFVFYLPQFKALSGAEVVTGNFHNVLTPRGALVRDTLKWSKVIDQMLVRYGEEAELMFASHHWPVWGEEAVRQRLENHRDNYRYVHDQTLRLANHGETLTEIAEAIPEPDFATTDFSVRDYYGTLNHNSKAVFQRYFGWWDGVPANYHRLPPADESRRYVAAMGGAAKALQTGQEGYNTGDYRWAATVFNHVVFAEPDNQNARDWLAAAYEQLGFQAESGAWRNYYLMGAAELRNGPPETALVSLGNPELLRAVPTPMLFDALAVRYNPEKGPLATGGEAFAMGFQFPDTGEAITVLARNSVMFPRSGLAEDTRTVLTIDRADFDLLILGQAKVPDLLASGAMTLQGDPTGAAAFFGALDQFAPIYNIIEP
jgi:alkyl sulfatase BDS1-like metallo-beta-lactamase superfamily hydrolase